MKLWRISNHADLSGEGGRRAAGRWHSRGRPIIYAAEHPTGALVEILVHLDRDLLPDQCQLITIEAPETISIQTISEDLLRPGWSSDEAFTRRLGDAWLAARSSLLLRVPSVILPEAWNMLINPVHPEISQLAIANQQSFPLDRRLTGVNPRTDPA
ncbi:RES family NAD+ phosphorylase [Aestuariivirga sp.]|uniref:RES family NAD+ phosphorylase n=1 Tax=Aestuariivirga sp. TaxID=2650926 RepID=UPI0039E59291